MIKQVVLEGGFREAGTSHNTAFTHRADALGRRCGSKRWVLRQLPPGVRECEER